MAILRARTGCWTCRNRRIKCDEIHPVCRRCSRDNRPCGYGIRLIWHEESIARGVCHGRAGVWSKRSDCTRRREKSEPREDETLQMRLCQNLWRLQMPNRAWKFLNTTMRDLEIHFHGHVKRNTSKQTSYIGSPAPFLNPMLVNTRRSECDLLLISYFEHIICSSSTLVDNAYYNPYRYLILPMALQSEGLYQAALAIAANTLRLSDSRYQLLALEHHNHALGHLRINLKIDNSLRSEKELDEMLGLVLMLCWFDISDNSRSSWVTHLSGFQDLIRARQERPSKSVHSQDLMNFFIRYFAFHLVLARTAFEVGDLPSDIPESPFDSPNIIDPYMGLSHSLLQLINQVSELAWALEDQKEHVKIANVYRLKKSLEDLDQRVPDDSIESTTGCTNIAETNRLGALLFLHEICKTDMRLPSLAVDEHNDYVERILELIVLNKASMMRTAAAPLWPLFLAGCCARDEKDRVLVLQLFEDLKATRRFGNIAPAMEVVEMVWRQRDLSVQDERKRRKHDKPDSSKVKCLLQGSSPRFEWEHAMMVLGGWKLSLT